MKFKSLAFLIMLLLLACSLVARAKETSLIAIEGSVFSDDGATLVPNGWNVDVTNKTQNLNQSSKTGDAGDGRYSVTFIDFGGGIVAATGDEIKIVITDTDGNQQESVTYILTDEDIDASSTTIDVVVANVRNEFPRWDVNGDGQVDISDLVLVGRHFGETIEEPVPHNPDVNGDGTVDINDLVLIGTPHRPVPPAEIVVVETGDPQVPIVAIHESGSGIAVLFDETQNKLQGAVYFSEKGDEFTVLVGEDGLPTQAFANGYVLLYENYTGDSVDIAIISPEGEIEVFRNISWSVPKQAYRATMRASSEEEEEDDEEDGFLAETIDVLNTVGTALSVASCVLSTAAPTFPGEQHAACASAYADVASLADSSSVVPLEQQKGWDILSIGYNLAGCVTGSLLSCASVAVTSAKNVAELTKTLIEIFTDEIAIAKSTLKKDSTSEDGKPLENGEDISSDESDEEDIPSPPEPAFDPNPPDGATDQPAILTLSWTASHPDELPMIFDVYFGTDASNLPRVQENLTKSEYKVSKLESNKTHYWQVITKDGQGNSVPGPIWSFSTTIWNEPPNPPFNPSPSHLATGVNIEEVTLTWAVSDPDGDAITYHLYFGTDASNLPRVESDLAVPQYTPPQPTEPAPAYFWKIVVNDDAGNSTEGDTWSFLTVNIPPGLEGLYTTRGLYCWMPGRINYLETFIWVGGSSSREEDMNLPGNPLWDQGITWIDNYSFTATQLKTDIDETSSEKYVQKRQSTITGTFSENFDTLVSLTIRRENEYLYESYCLPGQLHQRNDCWDYTWMVLSNIPTRWCITTPTYDCGAGLVAFDYDRHERPDVLVEEMEWSWSYKNYMAHDEKTSIKSREFISFIGIRAGSLKFSQ